MIDVIIPAYNCSKTLGRTLSSLVAQTYKDFRVYVIDDCSKEDITGIVNEYRDKLHIVYFRNKFNMGCGMSRERGIAISDSPYFCFLDSDDMLMPYTIEILTEVIRDNPDTELLLGQFYEQIKYKNKGALILRNDNFSYCHAKLYNRKAIRKYQIRNDSDVKYADDVYFNSMCFELLKADSIDLPLYLYVNNEESVIRKEDSKRDSLLLGDFIRALILSSKHVLKYKDKIEHLEYTIDNLKDCDFNDVEKKLYEELCSMRGSA